MENKYDCGTINQLYDVYFPERLPYTEAVYYEKLVNGFVLRVRLSAMPTDNQSTVLFDLPGTLTVSVRRLKKGRDEHLVTGTAISDQYFVYADEEGYTPVLEAELFLHYDVHPEWKSMSVGFPLNLYNACERDAYLVYDGVHFRWLFDGETVNENYPIGHPAAPTGEPRRQADAFAAFGISYAVDALEKEQRRESVRRSIQLYSPRGYNTWAGDVVNFYHNGVYHLIFFVDRHHHGNRFGHGAHHLVHMTTTDFVHWEEHGPLMDIQEPWQTFGTGTMFYYRGRYYYSHGWHSNRTLPDEWLGTRIMTDYFNANGVTQPLPYTKLTEQGLYPAGANYLVSEDGVHFEPGEVQFHWAENPSIYADGDDGLVMYAGYFSSGTWKADTVDGPWRLVDEHFPVSGEQMPMRNSGECPSFFEWNGYHYLIMGVTGFWQTEYGGNEYIDMAVKGYDVYDGLAVPMATKIFDNRVVLAGWVSWMATVGWGSYVVHRELIQRENGILGMKWMPEVLPALEQLPVTAQREAAPSGTRLALKTGKNYYLEARITPKERGRVAVRLDGEGPSCQLQLDTAAETAQISTVGEEVGFAAPIDPAWISIPREAAREHYTGGCWHCRPDELHFRGKEFSIAHVDVMHEPYTLRMLITHEPKMDCAIVDTEIAGMRTLISSRPGLRGDSITFLTEAAEVSDLVLKELE